MPQPVIYRYCENKEKAIKKTVGRQNCLSYFFINKKTASVTFHPCHTDTISLYRTYQISQTLH